MKVISSNRKAFFDYTILDEIEAGLVLHGPEIKAIRDKRVNITGSYIKPFQTTAKHPELWWIGGNFHFEDNNGDPQRTKKILLHTNQIERLLGKLSAGEHTVIPLELYIKKGKAKLKIALASRKQKYDKRETLKKRNVERQIERRLNDRYPADTDRRRK